MKIHKLFLSVGNGSSSASLGTNGMRHLVTATTIRAIVEAITVVSGDARLAGLVLAVLSSPPTMTILASRSRFAKTITTGPFPTMLNGAPCVVILNTSRFTSVLMLYSLCEYDASGYGRRRAPISPELGRHHQLPRPLCQHITRFYICTSNNFSSR